MSEQLIYEGVLRERVYFGGSDLILDGHNFLNEWRKMLPLYLEVTKKLGEENWGRWRLTIERIESE